MESARFCRRELLTPPDAPDIRVCSAQLTTLLPWCKGVADRLLYEACSADTDLATDECHLKSHQITASVAGEFCSTSSVISVVCDLTVASGLRSISLVIQWRVCLLLRSL